MTADGISGSLRSGMRGSVGAWCQKLGDDWQCCCWAEFGVFDDNGCCYCDVAAAGGEPDSVRGESLPIPAVVWTCMVMGSRQVPRPGTWMMTVVGTVIRSPFPTGVPVSTLIGEAGAGVAVVVCGAADTQGQVKVVACLGDVSRSGHRQGWQVAIGPCLQEPSGCC
jgi:hypothetical protein